MINRLDITDEYSVKCDFILNTVTFIDAALNISLRKLWKCNVLWFYLFGQGVPNETKGTINLKWLSNSFSPYKSIRDKIWPCCKVVKINLGSSFEQTIMGPSPQCYILSHKVIGPLVLEKKIFEGFLPYMGVVAILVMWPRPPQTNFCSPSNWGSICNLALIGQVVLEKIFENGGWRMDRRRTMAIL